MSSSAPTHESNTDSEHEALTYKRVGEKFEGLGEKLGLTASAMQMKKDTALTKALDTMSCIPCVQSYVDFSENAKLTVADTDAGTLHNPKVDVILEKSTPSSFGRGSETVLDPFYRSGNEIPAANVQLGVDIDSMSTPNKFRPKRNLLYNMKELMFPGREVNFKLYKLAVYETGGHFDWHMDTTHSDKHHGTLLVALNTSWTGGNLILRRNGIETLVDLQPKQPASDPDDGPELAVVAFFTDMEHCVEPVESGVRIVIQYDIELEGKKGNDETKKGAKHWSLGGRGKDKDKEEEEDEEDQEDEEEEEDEGQWMEQICQDHACRTTGVMVTMQVRDKAALEKVFLIIKGMHSKDTEEVAFALQHLYRRSSILPEYLKGPDATLYNALLESGDFDISLHPVLLSEESDWDGRMEERYVYRYDNIKHPAEDDESDESDESDPGYPPRKKKKVERPEFHIPKFSALEEISRQDYVEHTGNEAMPATYRYFGGGMFVRPKAQ